MADCIADCSADCSANCSADFRSNMYIAVSHTNGRCIKNKIGVVINRLVGMGPKGTIEITNKGLLSI